MSKNLGNSFIELSPSDQVSLTTIRLASCEDIFIILQCVDDKVRGRLIFFAYELLGTGGFLGEVDYYFEVVSRSCAQVQRLQEMFESSKKCAFIRTLTISILDLYEHLSKTSFRVYNKIMFKRLKLDKSQAISGARNLLTRMHFFQDVFCLNNLDEQRKFLAQIQQNYSRLARIYKKCNNSDSDDQRKLQSYLTGSFSKEIQIYLPQQQRQLLFQMMDGRKTVTMESQMKDCFTDDAMDIEPSPDEESYLLQLIENLKLKKMIEKQRSGTIESDLDEEKQRSRQKFVRRQ